MKRLVKLGLDAHLVLLGTAFVRLPTHWDRKLLICPEPELECAECRYRAPRFYFFLPVCNKKGDPWRVVQITETTWESIKDQVRFGGLGQVVHLHRPSLAASFEVEFEGELDRLIDLPRVSLEHVQEAVGRLFDLPIPEIWHSWGKDVSQVAKARMDAHHGLRPALPFDADVWWIPKSAEEVEG